MGKLRHSFQRVTNDRDALARELDRFRTLLGCNTDPAVTSILEGLIEEAEARLTGLEKPSISTRGP